MTPRTSVALFGLLTALFVMPAPARADGDRATDQVPRMLPYQGMLELDGHPLDAHGEDALHVVFALYDGPDAAEPVYRQPLLVDVYDGSFTTTIGPIGQGPDDADRPIADVIAAADALYLGITLLGDIDDPTDDIALARRQPIFATPYAMWTTSATDITVAVNAVVGAGLDVTGAAAVAGVLRADGAVTLSDGAIDTTHIADGTLRAADLAPATVGAGLAVEQSRLRIDPDWLDSRTRTWVRGHCEVSLGWRNGCNNCNSAPAKQVTVRANGACVDAVGANTSCRANNTWGGVNTDGAVSTDDVFYVRLDCD